MLSRPTTSTALVAWMCALLAICASGSVALAIDPMISEERLFPPVDFQGHNLVPAGADEGLGGLPYQDFTVQPPQRTFPNCRQPLLSWRLGPEAACSPLGPNITPELPAHAHRMARWYVQADLVALRYDGHDSQVFAERGILGLGPTAISSQDFDFPLDAGGQFLLGHKLTERLSIEATYLGSYEWSDTQAVRNDDFNILLGQGNLTSPFTDFGFFPVLGLDFNNFVQVDTRANLESFELMFRYRPDWVPYGAFDVSALYGLRYLHTDETLHYRSESDLPAPGSSVDYDVAPDNDMIGAQLGLSMHFLIHPAFWIDSDIKGGVYNNHARQRTVLQTVDENGDTFSFAQEGDRDDTSFTGDVKIIANYQLLPRLTLRAGYQATWVESIATGVSNFETDLDIIRFGPGTVDTTDHVVYHGPVLGVMWVR